MSNPLRKRYKRELKKDFGKYLVIFLFMIMLIAAVSGYFVAADSIEKTYYEGFDKYNVEDGHLTFNEKPDQAVLDELAEKAGVTFYNLYYIEEDIKEGTTLRVFRDRTEVDLECLSSGEMPSAKDEIALDRTFAANNDIKIGDTITMNGKTFTVSGTVALVDYNSLYENPSDMMFDSVNFGVAIVSDEGFDYIDSIHLSYNYAWKYIDEPEDETEENSRSEDFLDILEDVLKEYDVTIVQAQVDDLYDDANELSTELTDEFEDASDEITEKMEDATTDAAKKAVAALDDSEKMQLYMQGASDEDYLNAGVEKLDTTIEALVADELGTDEDALNDLEDAFSDMEDEEDSVEISDPPVITVDDLDDDSDVDSDMDFSTDDIWDIVDKIKATGIYDTSDIENTLEKLDDLLDFEFDEDNFLTVDTYIPKYQNKAITYAMDDMSSDKPSYIVFDVLVTGVIAFVFAITISNQILSEAGVIGTLRASGYTRGELIRHYMFLPMLVTVISAIFGNILGYTALVSFYKYVFYSNFSLANYENMFNFGAFAFTTLVPLVLMFIINYVILAKKMKLSPMRFLRHELGKKKRRAMLLNKKIPFITRFRLRIFFQNVPAYITLFVGILFGGLIAVFGFMFTPMIDDYGKLVEDNMISTYQYVLMDQVETENKDAEKYCMSSLEYTKPGCVTDEISVYGVADDSKYIDADIPEGEILIASSVASKFKIKTGDTLTLDKKYSDDTYEFKVGGIYDYESSLTVFMSWEDYLDTFNEDSDYFTGYFSNEELDDIDSDDIATVITVDDYNKVMNQMKVSMGDMMSVFAYFGGIMLILMMYILTKLVIEKNMQSIAMTKILGFRNGEISALYLVITSIVVLVSLFATIPAIEVIIKVIFDAFIYSEMAGYFKFEIDSFCFVKTIFMGLVCYIVVCALMMRNISKIEKSEALKNVE